MLWFTLAYCGFLSLVKCATSQDSSLSTVLAFVAQPSDITLAEHTYAAIPCVAVSASPVTYSWIHNGTRLALGSSNRRYRLMNGNLTIINTTLDDTGEYRCIASNRFGSALSLKADIRIAYLHASNLANNTITTPMYSSVKVPMHMVNSFPRAQFTWKVRRLRNTVFDKIADGENGRLLISQSEDLYIVGARSEDAGTYRCVVTNPVVKKEIAFDFFLKVLEGAVDRQLSFLLPPVTTRTTAGTARVVLECIVGPAVERGSPVITVITWHKHDVELNPIHNPKYSYPDGGNSRHKLIINDVTINDSDRYSCIATTKYAVITSPQAQLIVNHKPAVPSFQPGFPAVIRPFVGTDVTINCRASAGDVTWYKNAVSVLSSPSSRLSVLTNGSLLLQNASLVDCGLYQVFARTSVKEVSSPPIALDIAVRPPLKPTTLAPVTSTPTRSLATELSSDATISSGPTQSTTENHVTSRPSAGTRLHVKQTTTAGALVHSGTAIKGQMMLISGTVVGGVFLLLIILAMFCHKRQTRQRLRQGSIKLKTEPDDFEEFEMTPVQPRTTSPPRPISVRRLRNSESTQDLLQGRKPNEDRVSLDSNDNQFIVSLDSEDHASAHVNPTLISELATVVQPVQETLQKHPCSSSELQQIRTLNERESAELNDSGIEEKTSDSLRKFPEENAINKSIPLYSTVNKSRNGKITCRVDKKALEKSNDELVAEPLYHVLEEPGDDWDDSAQGETGVDRAKTASFYQSLIQCYQGATEEENVTRNENCAHGYLEELISSSAGLYQSLTPPNNENVLNDSDSLTSEVELNQDMRNKNESSSSPTGIYQPLVFNSEKQSHLSLKSERPRSVSGIYQPLRRRPVPFVRCWSAPQQGLTSQAPSDSTRPGNRQAETEPIYQTVGEEERCPLNLDDPGSSFLPSPRRTPRVSPVAQRRSIQEPLYMAVQVSPSRPNRRACHSENEPRYSPSPGRKNPSTLNPPVRGHRRNFSDGGRALSLMVNNPAAEDTSPPVERRAPSPLPRHLGHRRNRSDIGLCPIDRGQENHSRRLTSISDSGLPRTPSLGSLGTGEYLRSASDTTHCRVHIGP